MAKKTALTSDRDFFSTVGNFLQKREKGLFWFAFFFANFFALLLFDLKINIGGDDSAYILRALAFIKEGVFPSYQGPLYPVFLCLFVAVFGTNVAVLKFLSLFLTAGFFFLFYKAFKNRLPNLILIVSLFILSVNSYLLFYASQTYSEAFFMFVVILFFLYFLRLYDKLKERDTIVKDDYKDWILIGFLTFLITITKNIGLAVVVAVPLFFLLDKKVKSAGVALLSFLLFFVPFNLLKKLIWNAGMQIEGQGLQLLYKNPYKFSEGKEDFWGFVDRFVQNSHLYFSKHLVKMFGLRSPDITTINETITIVIYVLFIVSLFLAFRKNKIILFLGIYVATMLGAIFIVLQTRWDSDRMIIHCIPFIFMFLGYGIYELFRLKSLKKLQPFVLLFFIVMIFSVFSQTTAKVKKNLPVLRKNLRGDMYHGYTTDWVNYLKMAEWVGENLSDSSLVACRKHTMASIYAGGKKFYGIYRIKTTDADTLLNTLIDKHVTHVIMASLRRNSKKNTGYTVNTIQRYLAGIEKKYPGTFRQIHKIGDTEPAYLFELTK